MSKAQAYLLDADFALAEKDTLYRCLDKVLAHKDDLINFLRARWGELFGVTFDVLLYDLTSTYFESDTARGEEDLRQYGYSRDKRGDCRQVVIGLIVTPDGFPLSYEVLAGNTADSATLGDLLTRIETRYGKANRIWCMDRGVPTEATLAQMRAIGASYVVGTPKGRLTRLEADYLAQPWSQVREGLMVKQLPKEGETYVLALSAQRVHKERAAPSSVSNGMSHGLRPLPSAVSQTGRLADEDGGSQAGRRTCGGSHHRDGAQRRRDSE